MAYYVHGDTGSDSTGTGAVGAPWKTLAKAKTEVPTPAAGTVFYLAGTFREVDADTLPSALTYSSLTGVSFLQWPGQTRFQIRQDRLILASAWSGAGPTYTATLAAGLGLDATHGGISIAWETQINADGSHYGHLTHNAGAAAADSWDYNNGTGVLTIRPTTNGAPGGQADGWVRYILFDCNGLQLKDCTNCVVDGGGASDGLAELGPVAGSSGGSGVNYGFIGSGTGNRVRNLRGLDCGWHTFGFVGIGAGVNSDNRFEGCIAHGIRANTANMFVHHSGAAVSCEIGCENCTVYAHCYLDPDGVPRDPTYVIGAFFSHSSTVVNSMGWVNCTVVGNSTNPCTPFDGAGPIGTPGAYLGSELSLSQASAGTNNIQFSAAHGAAVGDRIVLQVTDSTPAYDGVFTVSTVVNSTTVRCTGVTFSVEGFDGAAWRISGNPYTASGYPVRAIGCVATGIGETSASVPMSFQRCRFTQPVAGASTDKLAQLIAHQVLFDSCEVLPNLDNAAVALTSMFRLSTAYSELYLLNATALDVGTDNTVTSEHTCFEVNNASAKVHVRNSIVGMTLARNFGTLVHPGVALTTANIDFKTGSTPGRTWIVLDHGANGFLTSVATYGNTVGDRAANETAWLANADTGAIFTDTPAFVDLTISARPTSGGNVMTSRAAAATHTTRGINGPSYDGHYGAWQFGGAALKALRAGMLEEAEA